MLRLIVYPSRCNGSGPGEQIVTPLATPKVKQRVHSEVNKSVSSLRHAPQGRLEPREATESNESSLFVEEAWLHKQIFVCWCVPMPYAETFLSDGKSVLKLLQLFLRWGGAQMGFDLNPKPKPCTTRWFPILV